MTDRPRLAVPVLLIIGAVGFVTGINWGLPSQRVNQYLFANQPAWTGQKVLALAGSTDDPERGADVASHAVEDRNVAVIVNGNDVDRARIVRRYRLMSYQPDEWNTLKALSEMKPGRGNFDPKLYQYGGLWVYPVGALLKTAAILHLVDLRADVTWYLDHPDAFGKFYIVARSWSVVWGLVGIVAVYAIVRRIVGDWRFAFLAGVGFIFLPIVVNMAHEAKPHLAGAVLMLLTVLAASIYVERGTRSAWMLAGALSGAALGMVLSTLPIFLVLPAMTLLQRGTWRNKIKVTLGALAIGLCVYGITNPYVPFNYVFHRGVLESNLGNSKAMYHAHLTVDGVKNAAYLIAAGTSPILMIAGIVGTIVLGLRAVRVRGSQEASEIRRRSTGLLLSIPAAIITAQCLFFADNKPGEFGRFMLFADIFLLIEAMAALATWSMRGRSIWAAIALVAMTAISGISYVTAFERDCGPNSSRWVLADKIRALNGQGIKTLATDADPAPYCLPPVNLFDQKLIVFPKDAGPDGGLKLANISVQALDVPPGPLGNVFIATPISWANKSFALQLTPGVAN